MLHVGHILSNFVSDLLALQLVEAAEGWFVMLSDAQLLPHAIGSVARNKSSWHSCLACLNAISSFY